MSKKIPDIFLSRTSKNIRPKISNISYHDHDDITLMHIEHEKRVVVHLFLQRPMFDRGNNHLELAELLHYLIRGQDSAPPNRGKDKHKNNKLRQTYYKVFCKFAGD